MAAFHITPHAGKLDNCSLSITSHVHTPCTVTTLMPCHAHPCPLSWPQVLQRQDECVTVRQRTLRWLLLVIILPGPSFYTSTCTASSHTLASARACRFTTPMHRQMPMPAVPMHALSNHAFFAPHLPPCMCRGPCPLFMLKSCWVQGVIDENTLVWGQGLADWLPAKNVKLLLPMIRTPEGECLGG